MTPRIVGIGTHIPDSRTDNSDLLEKFHLDASFITQKLGIQRRSLKHPSEKTSDLCIKAILNLQSKVNLDLRTIKLLCVVTQNPDRRIPHTSAIVHQALGLSSECMTFDISQGCSGYTHGIAIATAMMKSHDLQDALLLTCDPYSDIVNPCDKNTAMIFGDAATASYLSAKGTGYSLRDLDFGTLPGSATYLWHDGTLAMDAYGVLRSAANEVPASVKRLLCRNELSTADIESFLFHPGSLRLLEILRSSLGLDEHRAPFDIQDYGNTVSSSIPLMLATRFHARSASTHVLGGFGVGFTWATAIVEFN